MKLIKKTNRNFFIITAIILPFSSLLLFFSLNYYIKDEANEKLHVDELRIIEQLKNDSSIISIAPVIEVSVLKNETKEKSTIQDVFMYDPIEKEDELFRELSSVKEINGTFYHIVIRHSIIESKDFLIVIGATFTIIILFIFILLFFLNKRFSNKLWQPFYKNLQALNSFSLETKHKLKLETSDIDEFEELNDSLVKMTHKLTTDYKALKEFTENASHEIQTPLTIILMNLDEALQQDLNVQAHEKIYSCYQSVKRLSLLNEKLLLLTKLDNNQYNNLSKIDLCTVINEKLLELTPLIESNEIEVKTRSLNKPFEISIDPTLANILITNLLSNAIKHNFKKGFITIKSNDSSITFSNSSNEIIDPKTIFNRFKKSNSDNNSVGLGLAIAKKIALSSQLTLTATQLEKSVLFQLKKDFQTISS